jgi:hypothetical protein
MHNDTTDNKALVIIDQQRTAGALVFAAPNLECPPLYKAEATVIQARPDEFHNMKGKYMPNKAVVDRIGDAAGVDFIDRNCGVTTELREDDMGKRTVFVGTAQGRVRLPDGSWRTSTVEEYEFDPYLRANIDASSPNAKQSEKQYRLDYMKVGRQRASTGARLRVVRQLTGMPVTFSQAETLKPLVFSRIVQNTDYILGTKEGRIMAIAAATGVASALYGGAAKPAAAEQEEEPVQLNFRNARDDDFDDVPLAPSSHPDADGFDEPAAPIQPVISERDKKTVELEEWLESDLIGPNAKTSIQAAINDPRTTIERLDDLIGKCRACAAAKGAA